MFLDEVVSIKKEIDYLKASEPDLRIFIALGHSGFEMDKKIAADVPDIDAVIGGHTNTFLYSGKSPGDLKIDPTGQLVYTSSSFRQFLKYISWKVHKKKFPLLQTSVKIKLNSGLLLMGSDDGKLELELELQVSRLCLSSNVP